MPAENERTKQLRFLALVVASYTHWDLDEINERYLKILPISFSIIYLLNVIIGRNK